MIFAIMRRLLVTTYVMKIRENEYENCRNLLVAPPFMLPALQNINPMAIMANSFRPLKINGLVVAIPARRGFDSTAPKNVVPITVVAKSSIPSRTRMEQKKSSFFNVSSSSISCLQQCIV